MFALMSRRLHSHGAGKALVLEFHLHHSTTTTTTTTAVAADKSDQKNSLWLAEYLMKSLGFSKDEAISAAKKVTPRLKPITKDPDLVVNFLENWGLNKAQIKSVISAQPNSLLCNVEKTLKPKFEFIQELGVSGPDLVKFIMRYKSILGAGVDSSLKPQVERLKKLLGNDQGRVATVLMKCPSLLANHVMTTLEQNLLSLRNIGFSDKKILKLLTRHPKVFLMKKDGWIEDIRRRVENDLGIPSQSFGFYYGVEILCTYKQTTLDAKRDFLRRFGWSDDDISTMVRNFPLILAASEDRLRRTLNFLMNEVGYSPEYLASHPKFFSLSLEKRVIKRYEVLKILNEKNLIKSRASLETVISMPESKFLRLFIQPCKEKAPDVYRSYAERVQS